MQTEKICKTIHQYNRESVSKKDMEKLLEIASNYRQVKIMFMSGMAVSEVFQSYIPAILCRTK